MTNDVTKTMSHAMDHLNFGVVYSEADRRATDDAVTLLDAARMVFAPANIDEADFQAEVETIGLLDATFPLGFKVVL